MERTVLLAAATWVGGVGAWAVGCGYALATQGGYSSPTQQQQRWSPVAPEMNLDSDTPSPSPPPSVEAELVDMTSLPDAPLPLDGAPRQDGPSLTSAAPPELGGVGVMDDDEESSLTDSDDSMELRMPDDPGSGMLTESQRRRLAPIKSLKRTRRSRKLRVAGADEKNFVPLVRGARPTTEEAVVAAYQAADETITVQRERGEDYWVDPDMLKVELEAKDAVDKSREKFKKTKGAFTEEKLRKEIVAPYKNNIIGAIVVGIGVISVFFAAFPGLLELNEPPSIASFPDSL